MKKKCSVEGCDGDQKARGLCNKHYLRLLSGGDPHVPSQKERTLEERFVLGLAPQDPTTGCVEWVHHRNALGYGKIRSEGKQVLAHRAMWEFKRGPIPPGMKVCHHCDNPPCCNVDHLFLGTDADNMADMVAKGRSAKGPSKSNTKLTAASVIAIRQRLADGETHRVIAAAFGISPMHVSGIKCGRSWTHI